jgi:allophanate hydrolase subunit 2
VAKFLSSHWRLSPLSDRMGFRFEGPELAFKPRPAYLDAAAGSDPSNIVDDVTPLGGIQVPGGLEPIVMGVDFPSVGGYAKIATVISADLGKIGQLRPGSEMCFQSVDVKAAREAALLKERTLNERQLH